MVRKKTENLYQAKGLFIPKEVLGIVTNLTYAGYEAYVVGGCVRDLLCSVLGREKFEPNDWDVATNAKPEAVQELFPSSVYENNFGTVMVKTENTDPTLHVIEVTTFRTEGIYLDRRRPESVKFVNTIEEDLGRRDFTVNAIALKIKNQKSKIKISNQNTKLSEIECEVVDPYNGLDDLRRGVLRAVGNPEDRFSEDALRIMRAVRFTSQLGFALDNQTAEAAQKLASNLKNIAVERVRIEFEKMIMSDRASEGVALMETLGLLEYVVPELRQGIKCAQNQHHIFTVFEHLLRSLDYTVKKKAALHIRLAALFHDIGKPHTKRGEGKLSTFYGHEIVGARMTARILERLRFPKEIIDSTVHLVRFHMFYYNVGEVSASGVRRFLARIGVENVDDFLTIREADRIGSGVPKAAPYKLRHLRYMIEKVRHDPVSPKTLSIKGDDVMRILNIHPSPRVGMVLNTLLEEVLDEPKKNERSYLENRVEELGKLSESDLRDLAKKANERKKEYESQEEEEMKKKYFVS